jgi:hypothetical protein
LSGLASGNASATEATLSKIDQAIVALEVDDIKVQREASEALTWLRVESQRISLRQLAANLNEDAGQLSRVLNEKRAPSSQMIRKIRRRLFQEFD